MELNPTVVIDLDVAPPSRPERRRRPRSAALVLTAVLVLLLGSPSPRDEPLRAVTSTEERASSWLLTGDLLVSAHVSVESGFNIELQARALDGDKVVWSRWIEGDGAAPRLAEFGTHLAVLSGGNLLLVLDRADGRVRWEPEGFETAFPAGDQIVLWDGDRIGPLDLLGTGRVAWWQPFDGPVLAAATAGRYLVVVDEDGNAFAYVRRTGETVGDTTESMEDPVASLRIRGSTAYVMGYSSVTALRLPRLDVAWTLPVALPMRLTGCGTLLCVSLRTGMMAVDPATGKVRWSSPRWTSGTDGLVGTADGGVLRLDPETGRVLADVGPGYPVGDLILRGDRNATWLVDWRTGRLRGMIPDSTQIMCSRAGGYLACQGGDARVRVWRIPRE